jgi:hypothetical protein
VSVVRFHSEAPIKKYLLNGKLCDIIVLVPTPAGVAQLVEQLICNQQVAGSSPITSSNMEGFPSGQREQTVNLPSSTSMVRIHPPPPLIPYARLAELADAHGSGPCEGNFMQVQVLCLAPEQTRLYLVCFPFTLYFLNIRFKAKERSREEPLALFFLLVRLVRCFFSYNFFFPLRHNAKRSHPSAAAPWANGSAPSPARL